ncbi:MAG: hypothetical protein QG622_3732 [Actinomycetota bacterium]|nr:hypothetical protein [Actinomycetota bacterium]
MTAPDDPAGLFSFTEARQLYYSATARVWLGDDYRRAADDAACAVDLYLSDPPAERRLGELSLARLDLAAAHLGLADLDGACDQLREVMASSSRRRTFAIGRRLRYLAALLTTSAYAGSRLALEVREEITAFTSVALAPSLRALGCQPSSQPCRTVSIRSTDR